MFPRLVLPLPFQRCEGRGCDASQLLVVFRDGGVGVNAAPRQMCARLDDWGLRGHTGTALGKGAALTTDSDVGAGAAAMVSDACIARAAVLGDRARHTWAAGAKAPHAVHRCGEHLVSAELATRGLFDEPRSIAHQPVRVAQLCSREDAASRPNRSRRAHKCEWPQTLQQERPVQ